MTLTSIQTPQDKTDVNNNNDNL